MKKNPLNAIMTICLGVLEETQMKIQMGHKIF